MPNVSLPPELERFAEACVRNGRFSSVSQVINVALRLLQEVEARRAALLASVQEAEAEGERDGFLTIEEVMQDLDATIEAASRARK
jgi:putative addiction module CopG family antidote